MEERVLYEDNHLLALDKPAGWLTQPSGTSARNLEDEAKRWIKARDQKPGNVFLTAVHRIDAPVAGVVLFAKTSKALSRLQAAVRERRVKKTYHALVEGNMPVGQGTYEDYLVHADRCAEVALQGTPHAKLARLHYQVLDQSDTQSLLAIDLETGRYHQIRVQLASRGHPIRGDQKYGARTSWPKGIALVHQQMTIPHPTREEECTFTTRQVLSFS